MAFKEKTAVRWVVDGAPVQGSTVANDPDSANSPVGAMGEDLFENTKANKDEISIIQGSQVSTWEGLIGTSGTISDNQVPVSSGNALVLTGTGTAFNKNFGTGSGDVAEGDSVYTQTEVDNLISGVGTGFPVDNVSRATSNIQSRFIKTSETNIEIPLLTMTLADDSSDYSEYGLRYSVIQIVHPTQGAVYNGGQYSLSVAWSFQYIVVPQKRYSNVVADGTVRYTILLEYMAGRGETAFNAGGDIILYNSSGGAICNMKTVSSAFVLDIDETYTMKMGTSIQSNSYGGFASTTSVTQLLIAVSSFKITSGNTLTTNVEEFLSNDMSIFPFNLVWLI